MVSPQLLLSRFLHGYLYHGFSIVTSVTVSPQLFIAYHGFSTVTYIISRFLHSYLYHITVSPQLLISYHGFSTATSVTVSPQLLLSCPYKKEPMVYIPLITIEYNSVSFSTIGPFNDISAGLSGTLINGNLKYHSIPLNGTKNPKYQL